MLDISESVTPTLQESYTLTCSVSGAQNLNPIISYQWIKYNGIQKEVVTDTNTLSFQHLRLSDAGQYICSANVSSDYLDETVSVILSQDVKLQS